MEPPEPLVPPPSPPVEPARFEVTDFLFVYFGTIAAAVRSPFLSLSILWYLMAKILLLQALVLALPGTLGKMLSFFWKYVFQPISSSEFMQWIGEKLSEGQDLVKSKLKAWEDFIYHVRFGPQYNSLRLAERFEIDFGI